MSSQTSRRFHFLKEIASGGFGTVYLAKVMHADGFSRLVAVKLLKAHWTDSEDVARRIRDEARLLGLLRHRNIVDVIDLTSIDGRAAVVMEYIEGIDLRFLSIELAARGERIPVRVALEMAAAVAGALDAAYNRPPIPGDKPLRVIHRDIKPSNVMVDAGGTVKVLDFGVARSELENRESHTQDLQFGSVDYMAPERLFFEPETPASDVYSLAVSLYEILALEKLGKARGRPEKHAAHVADRLSFLRAALGVRGSIANELESLLRAMLAFDHERRPSAAEAYQRCRALARLADGDELTNWCERVLPELIEATHAAPQAPSPMTDTILTEDSLIFHRPSGEAAEGGELVPVAPGGPVVAGDELRRGALAELDDSDQVLPVPATGSPAAGREPPPPEPDEAEEWDDVPTTVGKMPAVAEPASQGQLDPFTDFHRDPSGDSTAIAHKDDHGRPLLPPSMGRGGELEAEAATQRMPAKRSPPPPVARPAAPLDEEEEDWAPPRRRAIWPFALLGGCLAVAVGMVGLLAVFAFDLGGIRTLLVAVLTGSPVASPEYSPPPEVVVAPSAPEEGAEGALSSDEDLASTAGIGDLPAGGVPAGGTLRFRSAADGTRKLRVECDALSSNGIGEVSVSLPHAKACTVTAILADRSRMMAQLADVEAGAWICFEGGMSTCVAE